MSQAAQVLQKANLNLQQRVSIQRSLAAQLRELTGQEPKKQEPQAKGKDPEPVPTPAEPEPKKKTNPFFELFKEEKN